MKSFQIKGMNQVWNYTKFIITNVKYTEFSCKAGLA